MRPIAGTPLHPQWLLSGGRSKIINHLENITPGNIVLDVGCFDKWPKKYIPERCSYIGLDYYETATRWYGSVPDIYGDALNLPIKNGSVNTVLLLDVLEHISDTGELLSGINHILSEKGQLIMSVPFLYPLHDEPRDFIRLTIHGFQELSSKSGFVMEECTPIGHPVETSFLLVNIAFSKTIIGWIENKNPASILILFFHHWFYSIIYSQDL